MKLIKIENETDYLHLIQILPVDCVNSICKSGDNADACNYWANLFGIKINTKWANEKRRSFGLEGSLKAKEAAPFILWCAAWDKFEDNEA